jgi:hypothetical protein
MAATDRSASAHGLNLSTAPRTHDGSGVFRSTPGGPASRSTASMHVASLSEASGALPLSSSSSSYRAAVAPSGWSSSGLPSSPHPLVTRGSRTRPSGCIPLVVSSECVTGTSTTGSACEDPGVSCHGSGAGSPGWPSVPEGGSTGVAFAASARTNFPGPTRTHVGVTSAGATEGTAFGLRARPRPRRGRAPDASVSEADEPSGSEPAPVAASSTPDPCRARAPSRSEGPSACVVRAIGKTGEPPPAARSRRRPYRLATPGPSASLCSQWRRRWGSPRIKVMTRR